MKRTWRFRALMTTLVSLSASLPLQAAAPATQPARFDWFDYRGTDGATVPAGQYRNPILAGFYPDPSIVRVGEDYYLINSTFAWFPGIPVFHSRDLVNWKQIGNAIDRPGQLDLAGLRMSRGIFAPAISHHDGRFYIVTTCVDCRGNFVITATDPAGPWSDPVWLDTVEGIDPSLFFDEDGSAWLVNNRAPAGPPLYEGHRAIWIERFDPATLKMMGGAKMVVDGGVDLAAKPVWIEGPHVFRKDGAYYLSAAEGGTGPRHSQVIFRADKVEGPYRPAPPSVNPILTQRDLPADRANPISAAGHVDMVTLPDGRWQAVFLATRPYAQDFYNIGRETYLLPVTWRDGWPNILPPGVAIPRLAPKPLNAMRLPGVADAPPQTGSYTVHDGFDGTSLGLEWMTMRGATVTVADGTLKLLPGDGLGVLGRPAFAARRQQHVQAVAETELRYDPGEGESAGLAALQNDTHFLTIALTRRDGRMLVRVRRRAGDKDPVDGVTIAERPAPSAGPIRFRIVARDGRYDLGYAIGGQWTMLARNVDATNLSTATAGGFVGTMIGPFASK